MIDSAKPNTKKTFTIETYGCQMNEYDTQLIRSILAKENFDFVESDADAQIILLNTCAIRENAHRKVYGRIQEIRRQRRNKRNEPNKHKKLNPAEEPLIGILGCMATNLRQELLDDRSLDIDFIAGPDSYKRLPDLIREASATGEQAFDVTLSEFETYSDVFPEQRASVDPSTRAGKNQEPSLRVNAGIAVMRGCNNFCTFCVVPYTRGRERSRSPENVLEEARRLAGQGFKQITLLGQNVNSYFYPFRQETDKNPRALFSEGKQRGPNSGYDFAYLLARLSEIEEIKRLRFISPHPKDFPDDLLKVVATNKKVCKHIHLPLQAGSDRILELMNRTYTQKEFLALAEKIRGLNPEIVLTTDVIVGFPTETDEEFNDTVKVVREAEFDFAYIFKYSERRNTIAERKYPDDVSPEKKKERIVYINDIQKDIAFKKNQPLLGKTLEVLIEGKTEDGQNFQGRTDTNKTVIVEPGRFGTGDMVDVNITYATGFFLKGRAV